MPGKTMFEKIWDTHVVAEEPGKPALLYVDLHLVHEVTSPQAFDGLRMAGRRVRRPDLTVATADHDVPTTDRSQPIEDPIAVQQLDHLSNDAREFNIPLADIHSPLQGIVHIIGPEQGYTQPGKVIVCGDSHTATHGAFGAFALGVGTSEVEHVLATQTLRQAKQKTMQVDVNGPLPFGVTAKDLILAIIGQIGIDGGTGHVIEYTGQGIRDLSMAGRMTVCNMSIEGGARAGHGRAGREDVRLPSRQGERTPGRRLRRGGRALEAAADGPRRPLRRDGHHRSGGAVADGVVGHQPRAGDDGHEPRAGPGQLRPPRRPRERGAGAALHGAGAQHAHHGHRD